MSSWNFADVWEVVADRLPNEQALVHGPTRRTWRDFDRRADAVARSLLDCGLREQDTVMQYMHNCVEYLESIFACFKAGLVPANTNYRYGEQELLYLFDSSDAAAVVFHAAFTERVSRIRDRLPKVRCWIWVDDGHDTCPDWAIRYDDAASVATARVPAPWGRSPDHLFLLFTGGTTGLPKGVMWRQDDLFSVLNRSATVRYDEDASPEVVRDTVDRPGYTLLCACPLMHGTGIVTALSALSQGGSVVMLPGRSFHAEELLDTVVRERVQSMAIVGDAFGRPIVDALERLPNRWDISSLVFVVSSGVRWTNEVKELLLRHHPSLLLIDLFGSSEALGVGRSVKRKDSEGVSDRFALGPHSRVISEDYSHDVTPGSGEVGLVAYFGRGPVGYYNDPDKSARTFPTIDGRRCTILGDYARVEADGHIALLGRGSACINTAGEKVFPEEVEDAIRLLPSVDDVAVVGVPDERYGEAVCALVSPRAGHAIDEAVIVSHVKSRLAAYKAPKHVVCVASVARGPNGKLDYTALRQQAAESVISRD
jgi:acyl-CoA synthetase (AMP-forming)/AMP-acid ligase II